MLRRAAMACLLMLAGACKDALDFEIPEPKDLAPGGVYIAYNLGCTQGCDDVDKGDLLQAIDGEIVRTTAELDAHDIADGRPHRLELLAKDDFAPKQVEIVATPNNDLPPLRDAPPFWTVDASKLDAAPPWARRRLFGHASPMIALESINGGILDGRQLYGRKRLMVYWTRGDRMEEQIAITFMRVLQLAELDLQATSVDIMFVQAHFPNNRNRDMSDSDLRAWYFKWSARDRDSEPLPMLPTYRTPYQTNYKVTRALGMEHAFKVSPNLGESPSIVILDERGIVRWHSEGLAEPPESSTLPAEQHTIISAVEFALAKL